MRRSTRRGYLWQTVAVMAVLSAMVMALGLAAYAQDSGGGNGGGMEQPAPGPAPAPAPGGDQAGGDPKASAVDQLEVALGELSPDKVSGKSPEELATVAKSVVNVLEGSGGEHFAADAPNPGDGTGAITYLEQASGKQRSEFPPDQLESALEAPDATPEVKALIHALLANSALTGGDVSEDVINQASQHIQEAINALQGA